MKYYIIAGEASGDLHASNLMQEIKQNDNLAEFRCWGGDLMQEKGGTIVKHYRDLAFMGFAEVIMNIRTIIKNIKFCKKDILNYNPDALILVDYPGFNLRVAKFAHAQGYKVFYYISPQIWAWKKSRVFSIKKNIDKMFCILPFEKDFYAKYDYKADYVGHPLLDAIKHDEIEKIENKDLNNLIVNDNRKIIALLPGSRKQEIKKLLPEMVSIANHFPDYHFIIAGVNWQPKTLYSDIVGSKNISIVYGATYHLLKNSYAALVTSGTATLETALFNIPQVVCYKANAISYRIAKMVVKGIEYISLPNLIMNRQVVKELIQKECNSENLIAELEKITINKTHREKVFQDYNDLKTKLGSGGASKKTALLIANAISDIKK